MEKRPLLSIVVPTKNRYIYLKELIKLVKGFNEPEIELVIQDNSDDNTEILGFLEDLKFDGVKYFYDKRNIPATENADKAILNSTGEYVCFIGDDDGIMHWIVTAVEYMKRKGIDSLIANKPNYLWPDIKSAVVDCAGTLDIILPTSKIRQIDVLKELNIVQHKGFLTMGNLPRVYHGIIKRDALNTLYEQTGTFFPGPCPDMSNAVGLSYIVKKHIVFDFPIIISGAGYNSAAGMGARHKHSAKISEVSFLPKNTEDEWERTIPKYWLPQTIWPNTAIKALRNTGHSNMVNNTNFAMIYGAIIAFNPKMFGIVLPYINLKNFVRILFYIVYFVCERARFLLRNIITRRFTKFGKVKKIQSLSDIIDAERYLSNNYHSSLLQV